MKRLTLALKNFEWGDSLVPCKGFVQRFIKRFSLVTRKIFRREDWRIPFYSENVAVAGWQSLIPNRRHAHKERKKNFLFSQIAQMGVQATSDNEEGANFFYTRPFVLSLWWNWTTTGLLSSRSTSLIGSQVTIFFCKVPFRSLLILLFKAKQRKEMVKKEEDLCLCVAN